MLHRFWLVSLFAVVGASCISPASGEELVLAEKGQTEYRIVVADDASPSTKHAAEELQLFLEQMTGAKLAIVSDREPLGPKEIMLGDNAHLKQLEPKIDLSALGDEGYVIETVGPHLVIAGGALRGNLYGVYGLLEDHLGCRWFTPEVSRIPKRERLAIEPIHDRQMPALEYREPFVFDCFDGDWCARNRMNSTCGPAGSQARRQDRRRQGRSRAYLRLFRSAERIFRGASGIFFAGRRQASKRLRPALLHERRRDPPLHREGDPVAARTARGRGGFGFAKRLFSSIASARSARRWPRPKSRRWRPSCSWSTAWPRRWRRSFRAKRWKRIAYQWTRQPPKNLRPRNNVIIMLCSIECCFSHPLATCDSEQNKNFREDLEGWSKTGARIWVWDYTTDFAAYMLPFPNQRVARPEHPLLRRTWREGDLRGGFLRMLRTAKCPNWAAT